jgi:malonyl CoA-acyl carrier protein transacylase
VTGNAGAGDRSVKVEAVQAVVDRITSWQDGAPEETVRDELLRGLAEAQVDVPADFVEEVVRRVRGGSEHFDVEPLLNNE